MNPLRKAVVLALCTALLNACQSTSEPTSQTVEINAENAYQSSLQRHEAWERKLQGIEFLEIYSPEKFGLMLSSWKKADAIYQELVADPELALKSYSLFSSATYLDRFNDEIEVVEKQMVALEGLKREADEVLAPAMAQMKYLDGLDAKKYYRSEYTRIGRLYARLFTYIDKDDLNKARKMQDEYLERAHSLEVKTVKKIYIAPLEQELEQHRRNDVKYYAPLSYNRVEIKIENGKNIIDATPRDFAAIEVAVKEIEFELAHAAHIALEVSTMRDLSKDQHEGYILEMENKLLRISKALNDQDLRDQTIRTQATMITNNVKAARLQYVAKTSLKTNEVSQRATALEALVKQQQQEIAELKLQLATRDLPEAEQATANDEPVQLVSTDHDGEVEGESEVADVPADTAGAELAVDAGESGAEAETQTQ
ncbi:hypothetical protein A3K86_14075 [Photobacterium jeanii]|uniref:DNA repair protein n=1 Tax=Photobacterium jeanii TaxID=858640 RepID=A0A178K9A8_9GAMM|nr:hypothetical protein [Photobacterium jeanii]OAN13697.1 hypothetical protein A3K86_14075 [Photobacterium jeanii]PST88818.1 hypothetical protein C9I91_15940 [Photobacterium jeanii]